jgi:hypothetical protein
MHDRALARVRWRDVEGEVNDRSMLASTRRRSTGEPAMPDDGSLVARR